jgi:hypothetical protein
MSRKRRAKANRDPNCAMEGFVLAGPASALLFSDPHYFIKYRSLLTSRPVSTVPSVR